MVRQFYLENSLGKRYELTNKNFKQFLNEPNGLGFVNAIMFGGGSSVFRQREYARLYTRLEQIKELVNE